MGLSRFQPWGGLVVITGSMQTDRLFTGQRREPATYIYDYGARFYYITTGQFMSPDSIVPQPGNPQSLNRYSYARNNPLNRVDPSGHLDIGALLLGVGDQFFDDVSLGGWSALNVDVKTRFMTEDSVDYNAGRVVGQVAALFTGGGEVGGGIATIAGSIGEGVGGSVLCAETTLGACVPVAVGISVAGVAAGGTMVAHGSAVVAKVLSGDGPLTKLYTKGQVKSTQEHHPWPKYLGGPKKQPLYTMDTKLHEAYHTGLDKIFSRFDGSKVWSELTPEQQREIITSLQHYNLNFDQVNGTNTFNAIERALMDAGISLP